MPNEVYRYEFDESVPATDAEETLLLAILAAASLHGESRVRLDASYCFDGDLRVCVIDASTEVGRDICRLFTGFATREFGEQSFKVRRTEKTRETQKQEVEV